MKKLFIILLLLSVNVKAQITKERFKEIVNECIDSTPAEALKKLKSIKDSIGDDLVHYYNYRVGVYLHDISEEEKAYELFKSIKIDDFTISQKLEYWSYFIGAAIYSPKDSATVLQTFGQYFDWLEKNKNLIVNPADSFDIVDIYIDYYTYIKDWEKAYNYSLLLEKYQKYFEFSTDDLMGIHEERMWLKYKCISSNKNNRFKASEKDLLILDSLYQLAESTNAKKLIVKTSIFVAKTLKDYEKLVHYTNLKEALLDTLCEEKQRAQTKVMLQESQLKTNQLEIKYLNKLNKQRKKTNTIITISLLITIVIIMGLYILFKQVKKQKSLVEQSKKIIEHKNKEMIDSIEYAKNIQSTIMKSITEIENDNCFVLYKPKDIVSGDFYWYAEKGQYKYYAAADCTGHGVPGALVSMLCSQVLNDAIKLYTLPNDILTYTNQIISSHMSKFNRQDGMDIALAAIDFTNKKVLFSGANRPLFIYSNNEVKEINGTKQSIGGYNTNNKFELVELALNSNDTIYLTTDGFIDQFGGEKNKKYSKKNLRALILKLNQEDFSKQKTIIDSEFNSWKGNNEQTDDICVIGVKL